MVGNLAHAVSGYGGDKDTFGLNDLHSVILYDASERAASGVVMLPEANADNAGKTYTIKKTDSSNVGVRIQVAGDGKIDKYKSEDWLWIKDDSMSFICGSGENRGFDWYTINRSLTPHRACVQKRKSWQQIAVSTETQIHFDYALFSYPSGMASFNYKADAAHVQNWDGVDHHGDYSVGHIGATTGSGIGSGVRILREGWYKAECQMQLGNQYSSQSRVMYGMVVWNGHETDPDNLEHPISWYNPGFVGGTTSSNGTHSFYGASVAGYAYLKPGDFIAMFCYQNSPYALRTDTGTHRTPTMTVEELLIPDPSGVAGLSEMAVPGEYGSHGIHYHSWRHGNPGPYIYPGDGVGVPANNYLHNQAYE